MKRLIFLFLIAGAGSMAFGFEGNDDNVTRDYYVQMYQSQPYVPDFRQVFGTESDRRDYKKLREYLNNKEEMLRILKMAGDEYYYGLSYSKLFATDYMQSLEDELKAYDPHEKILLRLNSVRPSFDYSGEYPIKYVETEILPVIRARYEETAVRDSMNQIAYMQIQKNVDAIQQDIFQAEQAIYASLSPEFRDQDFRIWISLTFSGLIAVLLLVFFWIIFKRSDVSLSKHLLSSSGLQFITVFILIIAIVLFGILNVLGGSELAAILSGISGYILGKGGNGTAEASAKPESESRTGAGKEREIMQETAGEAIREEPYIFVAKPDLPEAESQDTRMEKMNKGEAEDEKYFPGIDYQQ
jgi:hypothetical protein